MLTSSILKKPLFWLFLITILLWLMVLIWPDKNLHLIFCDVGQGDATLITYKQTQILIDGGPDNKVLNCLSEHLPFWDRKIEMVILTHPEKDHFGGLIDVIKRYNVRYFVVNSLVNDKLSFWEFYQAVLAEKAPVYSPKVGEKIRVGPMDFLVLWPKEKLGDSRIWEKAIYEGATFIQGGTLENSGELNETSIVLQLSFGHFQALFTGDIPSRIEKEIIEDFHTEPVEVLKVAHHGSKNSTSEEFLENIKPKLAVISVGKNRFGHPTPEVLERLFKNQIKTLRTDKNKDIEIVSNGGEWWLRNRPKDVILKFK